MEGKEKCSCEKSEQSFESDSSNSESSTSSKKGKIGLFNLRKNKHLHFSTKKSKKSTVKDESGANSARRIPKWSLKFNCTKKESKIVEKEEQSSQACCRCACYKHAEESETNTKEEETRKDSFDMTSEMAVAEEPASSDPIDTTAGAVSIIDTSPAEHRDAECQPSPSELEPRIESDSSRGIYGTSVQPVVVTAQFGDIHWLTLPSRLRAVHEDCDEAARMARAREIEQGVDPPANFRSARRVHLVYPDVDRPENRNAQGPPRRLQLVCPPDLNVESLRALFQNHVTLMSCPLDSITGCHTQVDFIHCLVPDLLEITNCSFYWGKMDRYEAERLLDGKPEGTFLLRDSAQEEFLFSVSFRKYGRSLHARIEQWNHRFSFDSHDPGVFTSDTVCGLIEHYKDPSSCMFFEPMLTSPLHRKFVFPLQHLARASIVSRLTYDNINHLQLPKTLKTYLKEYHYRQKVRVERFDDDVQWLELRNVAP